MSLRYPLVIIVLLSSLAIAGCEWQGGENEPAFFYRLSSVAPPEPRVEAVPFIDSPRTEIWRPGYWAYDNGNFSWVAGELINRPSAYAVWSPDRWSWHNFGWAFEAGHWE